VEQASTLPDLEDLIAPLEQAIADVLIPSIIGDNCTQEERELLALLVRMGGMCLTNPSQEASSEYVASVNISGPSAVQATKRKLNTRCATRDSPSEESVCERKTKNLHDQVKSSISGKTLRPWYPERRF